LSQNIPNENTIGLSNIDPEVIDGVMSNIQKSFDIVFTAEELMGLQSMGQLCNLVTNKIRGKHKDDCSSQQAFYKLQLAITDTLHISKDDVFPETSMATLFPRKLRRSQITKVERQLGIKIKILRAAYWLTATLALVLFAGFIGLFLDWTIALFGILVAVTGLYFADKFGIELEVDTVGEWTDKIARENYLKARRNSQTVNRNEIAKTIRDMFIHKLGLEPSGLSEDTRFNFFEPVDKEDKDEVL
jgi:hypothetical protein